MGLRGLGTGGLIMKKIIFTLAFLLVSNTAFAAWKCDKVSTTNQGETLSVTMSCSDGIATPISLSRPVFRPERKADIKNMLRSVAIELREKTNAIEKVSVVQAAVNADNSLSAKESDLVV